VLQQRELSTNDPQHQTRIAPGYVAESERRQDVQERPQPTRQRRDKGAEQPYSHTNPLLA